MSTLNKKRIIRKGIYKERGDYHKNIDPKWSYYPLYLEKLKFVDTLLSGMLKKSKILDIGSGEGALVEKYRKKGYDIEGLDLNYSSKFVKKGDILKLPYPKNRFDLILCLDVLQYIEPSQQSKAIKEIKRVVKKNGLVLFILPNLAHFASRLYFLFFGELIRTDRKTFPRGDRPIKEYLDIIKKELKIIRREGIFPTNFILSSLLIKKFPDKLLWLFKIINFFAYPNWCFLNVVLCKK
jgi:SAM-dependent methyltransferase